MMYRWVQKLLGCHVSILHLAARMMIDVDGLSRQFGSGMVQHLCIAALLHKIDVRNIPNAYNSSIGVTKILPLLETSSSHQNVYFPVFTARVIASTTTTLIPVSLSSITTTSPPTVPTVVSSICSFPILLCHAPPVNGCITSLKSDGSDFSTSLYVPSNSICHCLFIDDFNGSFCSWDKYGQSGSVTWYFVNYFTTEDNAPLFRVLHPSAPVHIMDSDTFPASIKGLFFMVLMLCSSLIVVRYSHHGYHLPLLL